MDSFSQAERLQRVKDAHRNHVRESLTGIDWILNELYELAEYINDPDYGHEQRYIEIVHETLEYLHNTKERDRQQNR